MAFLKYTLLRTALLLVTGGVLYVVGLRGVWLVLVALLLSGIVSVVVLRGPRGDMSAALVGRVGSMRQRMDDNTTAEDAWDDAQRAAAAEPGDPPAHPDGARPDSAPPEPDGR